MAILGGADEVIVGDVQGLPQVAELGLHGIAPCLGRIKTVLLRGFGNLLAMLVHAREELHVVGVCTLKARLDIRHDGGVCGTKVRLGVHVVDRRGDVVRGLRMLHGIFPSDKLYTAQRSLSAQVIPTCHFTAYLDEDGTTYRQPPPTPPATLPACLNRRHQSYWP